MAFSDITKPAYNGEHEIVYKNASHRYYVDGKIKQGVTTTIGKVLAKPSLMLWPLDMAIKHLQTKLPVITQDDLEEAKKAHITARDKGGNTGSIVHELIEAKINGVELPDVEQTDEVVLALKAFDEWNKDYSPEFVATEQIVYSKELDYAGTFDAVVRIGGKTYLCDFKTTNPSREAPNGIYAEYFVQLGAYLLAYNEQREYEKGVTDNELVDIDGLMVVSIKKNGIYDVVTNDSIDLSIEDCLSLWKSVKYLATNMDIIKKKLGGK